ncbi:capsular biosynthesis protein [Agrilactobacillus yilanensis]|uniref:Capsular biosynthesis protein n=1 Tax=Agrilactobacillus yilanensis TaxID=2485997 RepID=A0ABW4J8X8_9LACO|nr:capsular biosynthesis protein [Agrilactobacillus yilanensis]
MKIDFVLPWIDGHDPKILAQQKALEPTGYSQVARFRDYGTLAYWFRAVERYTPWVNHIFLLTNGQVPPFLNQASPKVTVIDHRAFIPEEYLPTFNSNTIELNLHRIPALAEHFVLFNDDLFINAPLTPNFFFNTAGLPRYAAIFRPIMPQSTFDHLLLNNLIVLNQHFNKFQVLKANLGQFLSPLYGLRLISNLGTWLHRGGFEGFVLTHTALPHLKSTFEAVWQAVPQEMTQTCQDTFRQPKNECNQYLVKEWNICTGRFAPGRYDQAAMVSLNDILNHTADFQNTKHKLLCINDDEVVDFSAKTACLAAALAQKFPEKSQFEA